MFHLSHALDNTERARIAEIERLTAHPVNYGLADGPRFNGQARPATGKRGLSGTTVINPPSLPYASTWHGGRRAGMQERDLAGPGWCIWGWSSFRAASGSFGWWRRDV
ncbi:hypothetical protein [Paracoccus ravus]|uniref:hypothetical protein n=1 Tax=Paracoccus ravus TaxID=2447760 RepID=UPI00106E1469|nr:hypothetical protein [Paracoccus ravus]